MFVIILGIFYGNIKEILRKTQEYSAPKRKNFATILLKRKKFNKGLTNLRGN